VKKFVLVRGKSGRLHLYPREVWRYMAERDNTHMFELVVDHDDKEVLRQMQALANDKMED